MWLDLIAVAVLALSLVTLALVVGRKLPLLASIRSSPTADTLAEKKSVLIEQRLLRKFTAWREKAGLMTGPVGQHLGRWFAGAQQKLANLEHEYKVRSLPVFLSRRQRRKLDEEIHSLLTQARALADDGEHAAAEEKALQAIRLEPRSVPAFDFLGGLYMKTNEYGQAKEVYRYLLKLVGESDAIYEHLGEADLATGQLREAQQEFAKAVALNNNEIGYCLNLAKADRLLEEWPLAFERIQEAARREPNNPKILDEYIEISIGCGKRQFAEAAVDKLAEVNPENSKIEEWRRRIDEMETNR